jgi:SulP family sulfate permease
VTVLLAGVRPDFVKILRNVGINKWFPTEQIFPEEDRMFSATLRAVRYGNQLATRSRGSKGANAGDTSTAPDQAQEADYYLV